MNRTGSLQRQRVIPWLALLAWGLWQPAMAYDRNSTSPVNVDANGVALNGYDPVAYFTAHAPRRGSVQFSAMHEGATYQFESASNRELFRADPARYAPQYGGFCAVGAAHHRKIEADPRRWRVVADKLYVNNNWIAQRLFVGDEEPLIARADSNWTEIRDRAPKDL